MKGFSCVLAAVAAIAIALPTIASAADDKMMMDKPMMGMGQDKPMEKPMHHRMHHKKMMMKHHTMKKMMKKDGM